MTQYLLYNNPVTHYISVCYAIDKDKAIDNVLPVNENGNKVPYIVTDTFPLKYTHTYKLNENTLELEQVRDKLHELKKEEWRQKRAPLLTKYDVVFMRALEMDNQIEINRIKDIKYQLRDVTAINIDHLSNAELEDYTPEILTTL